MTVRSHDGEVTWRWGHMTVRSHDSEITWQWGHMTVRSHDGEVTWQGGHMTVRSHDGKITWRWVHMTVGVTHINEGHLVHQQVDDVIREGGTVANDVQWVTNKHLLTRQSVTSNSNHRMSLHVYINFMSWQATVLYMYTPGTQHFFPYMELVIPAFWTSMKGTCRVDM